MKKEIQRFADSTVMEGYLSIRAVLWGIENTGNTRVIRQIWYDSVREKAKRRELAGLRKAADTFGYSMRAVSAAEIDAVTVGNTHGGIIAFCSERALPSIRDDCVQVPNAGFYMMLQGIEDPYNFGYALRSAYAAGVDGIVLSPRNWMSAAGVVCRSSAGASERLQMFVASDEEAAAFFREKHYRIVCADMDQSVSVYDADLKKPLLLIVGGEKRGISRGLLSQADQIVRLDYGRPFPAALSAASAASILSFEVLRQNRGR